MARLGSEPGNEAVLGEMKRLEGALAGLVVETFSPDPAQEVFVSLRQPPQVTPCMIAANRANAQKSTGPRTDRGKVQVTLSALKHGGYAGRLFRSDLLRAREDVALYDWMYRQICDHFRPVGKPQWAQAQRLARKAWCGCRSARQEGLRSGRRPPTSSSVWCLLRIPTCLVPQSGIRLQFWARRRRGVWPRLPLMGLSDFPAHLDARVLVKKALEVALEASPGMEQRGAESPTADHRDFRGFCRASGASLPR